MNCSFLNVVFSGLLLATIPAMSHVLPASPLSPPDVPDTHYKGGGDNVPSPAQAQAGRVPQFYTPKITGARMVNGRVAFTFNYGGYNNNFYDMDAPLRYIIRWSRPGKTEEDMRWPTKAGRGTEEYIINEIALPDTFYWFRVQAESKNKTVRGADGIYRSPLTDIVGNMFHTPSGPSIADKIKAASVDKNTVIPVPDKTTKPSPIIGNKVDTPVRLIPGPIIGK